MFTSSFGPPVSTMWLRGPLPSAPQEYAEALDVSKRHLQAVLALLKFYLPNPDPHRWWGMGCVNTLFMRPNYLMVIPFLSDDQTPAKCWTPPPKVSDFFPSRSSPRENNLRICCRRVFFISFFLRQNLTRHQQTQSLFIGTCLGVGRFAWSRLFTPI